MDVSKNQPQPSHGQNKAFCKFVLGAVGSCTRPSRNVSCMKFDFGAMCAVCNCIKKEIAAIYTPGYTWINTYIYIWYHIYDISYIYIIIYIYTLQMFICFQGLASFSWWRSHMSEAFFLYFWSVASLLLLFSMLCQ
jgi:hypothetical protein